MNNRLQFPDRPDGTIYLTTSGSQLYGTNLDDADRDEMGVYVEHPAFVTGLRSGDTVTQRSQDHGVRSGHGDLDRKVYGLRKFAKLAANGNPTVLLLLFTPPEHRLVETPQSRMLTDNVDLFLSKQAGHRFLGYLDSQRKQLLERSGSKHTNRPELVAQYGYDTKFAYHALRLGLQGIELMRDGAITLPMRAVDREWLLRVRRGELTFDEVSEALTGLRFGLELTAGQSDLPEEPYWDEISELCHEVYLSAWREWEMV